MSVPSDPSFLTARRDHLRRQLPSVGNLRPGSPAKSYRRCGKPNRLCAARKRRGDGPHGLLIRPMPDRTRRRSVPASQVEATNDQIAECRRLRHLVADLIAVSDDFCLSRLKVGTGTARK